MTVTGKELKEGMALPPIPQQASRTHHGRNRDRIRMELSPERAKWLVDMITTAMKTMDIDSADFRDVYPLYRALSDQIAKHK